MTNATGPSVAPVRKHDILGCWRLHQALEERDGSIRTNSRLGENPTGFLHYLDEDRVVVTIAFTDRALMTGERRNAPTEELAQAARTFDAYAGRFSLLAPNQIAHHVEVSSYQNDVGTDFVRRIVRDGDFLTLYIPAVQENGQTVQRRLVWRRLRAS